ncbi:MAG: hypothetical protein AAGJ31_11540, partial [Verrucomicrobiota bacterium]
MSTPHQIGVVQGTPQPIPTVAVPTRSVISVEDLVRYLKQFWKLGVLAGAAVFLGTFLFLAGGAPQYLSSTHLRVEMLSKDQSLLGEHTVVENFPHFLVNTHKLGLKTRAFQDFVFERLDPRDRGDFLQDTGYAKPLLLQGSEWLSSQVEGWKEGVLALLVPSSKGSGDGWERELFVEKLNDCLRITELKESHVIRVDVTGPNRALVAGLANQYVRLYVDYLEFCDQEEASTRFADLNAKVEEYRERSLQSTRVLNLFRAENDLLSGGSSLDERATQLLREKAELRREASRSTEILTQVETLRRQGGSLLNIRDVAESEAVRSSLSALAEAEQNYHTLRTKYGDLHRLVREASDTEKARQAVVDREVERAVEQMQSGIRRAEGMIASLDGEFDLVMLEQVAMAKKAQDLAALSAKAESDRKTYEVILRKIN